ncbi:MAG TPA: hypothetical protein VIJ90_01675 [Gemmatimonadaceae bacterium]
MSRFTSAVALAGVLALASTAYAQPPGRAMAPPPNGAQNGPPAGGAMGGPTMRPPTMDVASMLLAHTGEFKLTDQQVTRLAAIARRSADRRKSMMASVDSLRAARAAAPPAGANARPGNRGAWTPQPAARALVDRMREQGRADLRDAIGVLTIDQQAMGWEMMARRGGRGQAMARRMGMRGAGGMGAGMRGGPAPQDPNQVRLQRSGQEPRTRPTAAPPAAPSETPANR